MVLGFRKTRRMNIIIKKTSSPKLRTPDIGRRLQKTPSSKFLKQAKDKIFSWRLRRWFITCYPCVFAQNMQRILKIKLQKCRLSFDFRWWHDVGRFVDECLGRGWHVLSKNPANKGSHTRHLIFPPTMAMINS